MKEFHGSRKNGASVVVLIGSEIEAGLFVSLNL